MGQNCLVKPPDLPFIPALRDTREEKLHPESHKNLVLDIFIIYTEGHSNRQTHFRENFKLKVQI